MKAIIVLSNFFSFLTYLFYTVPVRCPVRKCEVNLRFECWDPISSEIVAALKYALKNDVNGVKITKNDADGVKSITGLQFSKMKGKPLQFAFNSDYHAVQYDDLTHFANGKIVGNVHIVPYQNSQYVHKFVWPRSYQQHFEREAERYCRLKECDGILPLRAVVKRDGVVQGLLITYIDGKNLWTAEIKSDPELLKITYRIIEIASSLESVGFYHEDLKCQNIVRRRSDGALYFVDLVGGLTDGFYREEAFDDLFDGNVTAKEGMYILGKTLWQL